MLRYRFECLFSNDRRARLACATPAQGGGAARNPDYSSVLTAARSSLLAVPARRSAGDFHGGGNVNATTMTTAAVVSLVRPARCCSPRHRMQRNSIFVSIKWRAIPARP